MHAHEVYPYDMHACEMHARKTHAYEMHAHETHAYEMNAYEVHAHEVYPHGMHARKMHAHEGFCEDLARQTTVTHLSQLHLGFRRCRILVLCCHTWASVTVVAS